MAHHLAPHTLTPPSLYSPSQLLRIEGGAYVGLLDRAQGGGGEEDAFVAVVEGESSAHSAAARRRTTELVAGTTRWRRRLDFVASTLSGRSMSDVDPIIRQILRLGKREEERETGR